MSSAQITPPAPLRAGGLLDIAQAAERLGVTERFVRRIIAQRRIPSGFDARWPRRTALRSTAPNRSPATAATWSWDRRRSACARVGNDRVRSRPSTRHFTR